jgi:elongation factor P hydroxylase
MKGGLQVRWDDGMDSHVLYHGENRIASHHNGFSCHNLAERMLAGNEERALAQFDYITACGGKHYMTQATFIELIRLLGGLTCN